MGEKIVASKDYIDMDFFECEDDERIVRALHKVVFENPKVPAKKIAKHLGIPYKTLSKMCSEDTLLPSIPKFPLVKLPKLSEAVDITPIIEAVCFIDGCYPVKADNIKINPSVVNISNTLIKTQQASKQMANLVEKTIEALEDGKLTEEEYKTLMVKIYRLREAIGELEAYLNVVIM